MHRDIPVNITTSYAYGQGKCNTILGRFKDMSLQHHNQIRSKTHWDFYPGGTGGNFLKGKVANVELTAQLHHILSLNIHGHQW
jgi:hypothetical protein